MEDFLAAAMWLKSRPDSTGKLGAVGFCFGGGIVNQLAVRMGSDLAAAVPFYGAQPSAAETAKITAPINTQYGELDTRITGGWHAFDAALGPDRGSQVRKRLAGGGKGIRTLVPPVRENPVDRSRLSGATRASGTPSIVIRARPPRAWAVVEEVRFAT
jgi:hypothetical protein